MDEYIFYYDETEHSRVINYKTVNASNYYDNFITMIIGWAADKKDILKKHADFEEKYADRKDIKGEIKSKILHQKEFKYGFASLNKQNAQLVDEFLSIFDRNTHIYFSVSSKIEYLILQLFSEYKNNFFIDADLIKYSIIKALVRYRPEEIIKSLYESPIEFLEKPKKFFEDRINYNKNNFRLKQKETEAFQQILIVLDDISGIPETAWDYHMSFDGFKKYLSEKNILNYKLIIDKEGKKTEKGKTLKAACEIGLSSVDEADSRDYQGLRIADMLAGIMAKLMKGLSDSLRYQSPDDGTNKKILSKEWFCLNEVQFGLYKKLYCLICEWQLAWYKSYSGIYSDDLIEFIALLNFMNHFESVEQIQNNIDMQGAYFNAFVCEQLESYFEQRGCKLPIEFVKSVNEKTYINQSGAKRYSLLPLQEHTQTYDVLSVGVDSNLTPTIVILKNGKQECFRLPNDLNEWACYLFRLSTKGINLFPIKVVFSNINGKYYADIL